MTSAQTIITELVNGPMDATESILIVEEYDAGLLTDGEMRAAGEALGVRRRQQLDEIRARYDALVMPEEFASPEFGDMAGRLVATVEEMFEQAELLIRLEAETFNRLSDKDADLWDIVSADYDSRRLTIRALIGLNDTAILSMPGGHPQEFLLRALNGNLQATLALLDIQETYVRSGYVSDIDVSLAEIASQADRMRRFSGAGRNAIEPTLARLAALGPNIELLETFSNQEQVIAEYPQSFDEVDRIAAFLDAFVEDLPNAGTEEEFWLAIDTLFEQTTMAEDRLTELQQERARLLTGQ